MEEQVHQTHEVVQGSSFMLHAQYTVLHMCDTARQEPTRVYKKLSQTARETANVPPKQ
jgi:hypothetical protein